MKKQAFTLAEVLITLGIIGVVAAMTIPTLVQNYNTRTWNTGAKVFERKLEEALKTMNTQSSLAGHSSTESFVEELSKHFKTNKICQNDELLDCFSDIVYWGGGDATPEEVDMSIIKTAKNFGQDDWDTNIVGVQFANGTSAMIAYNPTGTCTQDPYSNQVTGGDCLAILYDTSGAKNPNTSGKDLRANGNVTKLGKGCFAEIDGVCLSRAPFISEVISKDECETMMSTHGINSCFRDPDRWVGAVKDCGHVDNMISMEQIAKIANYVYNTNGIGANGNAILPIKNERAAELGLPATGDFSIWSGNETSQSQASFRGFYAGKTLWGETDRYGSNSGAIPMLTICVNN